MFLGGLNFLDFIAVLFWLKSKRHGPWLAAPVRNHSGLDRNRCRLSIYRYTFQNTTRLPRRARADHPRKPRLTILSRRK
jgi:hypothetical protein